MKHVLIISGHPHLDHSLANRTILEETKKLVPSVEIRRLDQLAGHFEFNIPEEQDALRNADIVVLEFPMYWYAYPALLKKYIDDVFAHGFAYGSKGTALRGKKLVLSFTAGAPKEAYVEGNGTHALETYMLPGAELAALCGMSYEKPVCTPGCMYVPGVSDDRQKEKVIQLAKDHARQLVDELKKL